MTLVSRRRRHPVPDLVADARPVVLGDVADPGRTMTTYVERPDRLTALPHAAATVPVDRDAVVEQVRGWVRDALAAGALDELTGDFLDARIASMRVGWDHAVEVERRSRAATLDQLTAMERHDLTFQQDVVRRGRAEVAGLRASVQAWRAVLRGAPTYAPGTDGSGEAPAAPAAPLPVDLAAAGAASRAPRADDLDAAGDDFLTQLEREGIR